MVDSLFIVPALQQLYWLVEGIAAWLWATPVRGLIYSGYIIQVITDWLRTDGFGPLIALGAETGDQLLIPVATVAVFLAGLQYVLAAWFKVNVVEPRSALAWLLGALVFYASAAELYTATEQLRMAITSAFYQAVYDPGAGTSVRDSLQIQLQATSGAIVNGDLDPVMGALQDNFGADFETDVGIDGLDVALAFIMADAEDFRSMPEPLPEEFAAYYYDPDIGPSEYLVMTPQERAQSVNRAMRGVGRLMMGTIVITFGILEQLVNLFLALAAAILFVTMSVALLFALFQRTNLIARSILDAWIELLVFSAVVSAMQSFTVVLLTLVASSGNPTLVQGATLLGLLLMSLWLFGAVRAVSSALNRIFSAIGQATGLSGRPQDITATVVSAGVGAAIGAATGGAGLALLAGGSNLAAQGLRMSGAEGSASAMTQMASHALILSRMNRQGSGSGYGSASAQPSARALPAQSTPARVYQPAGAVPTPPQDLSVLTDAIRASLGAAPQGGYSDYRSALASVQDALIAAGRNPALGSSATSLGSFVHNLSQSAVRPETGATFFRQIHSAGPVEHDVRARIDIHLAGGPVSLTTLERQARRIPVALPADTEDSSHD